MFGRAPLVFSVSFCSAKNSTEFTKADGTTEHACYFGTLTPMTVSLIGLGSNLGSRRETLRRAIDLLQQHEAVRLTAQSDLIETRPIGGPPDQGPFLNGVAMIETSLDPHALLALLQRIEQELGRSRTERWAARTVDLDLLLYGDQVIETPSLAIPHPGIVWRRFVLEPAAEVAPSLVHPTTGWTLQRLLDNLNNAKPYVAIVGSGASRLAEQLASRPSTQWIAAPTGQATTGSVEWLDECARLLDVDSPAWGEPARLWISDFRPPSDARHRVQQPKLTVLLQGAIEPGSGPTLRVTGDEGRVLAEVTAVLDAVGPPCA